MLDDMTMLDDMNGYAYLMCNYQHAGDFTSNADAALKTALEPMIDKYKAATGYIDGLPGLSSHL